MTLTKEQLWTLECLIDDAGLDELYQAIKKNKRDCEIETLIEKLDRFISH